MIHLIRPYWFVAKFEAVGCMVEDNQGNILQLLRTESVKVEPLKFGLPGGKIEIREGAEGAMLRELFEETGLKVSPSQLMLDRRVYVDYGNGWTFVYWIYKLKFNCRPEVVLSNEHTAFVWIQPADSHSLPLMRDAYACIKLVYGLRGKTHEA
jgi:8-oxo-dGTP diphosphatase